MANTSIKNDSCYVKQQLVQSGNVFTHVMNPAKYNVAGPSQCRPILGIVGGNNVSRTTGNMVDLESDLRGQTRVLSGCDSTQWYPTYDEKISMNNLPACQFQSFKPVVQAPPVPEARCGYAPKSRSFLDTLFG